MSKDYCNHTGDSSDATTIPAMREWCKRPGKSNPETGKPIYFTEQHHKDSCDVNKIVQKYSRTGLIEHVSRIEAKYGDLKQTDFKDAMDLITGSMEMFKKLPSNIRKRFANDPAELIRFMEDSSNREEAIKLGIISANWTPETDGLGEHVKAGENVNTPPTTP